MYSILALFITISISTTYVCANENNENNENIEVKDMSEMMAQINLEKKQMEDIVNKLVLSGRISKENELMARREIASVKEEDIQEVKLNIISLLSAKPKD
jgi:hypothetical protein